MNTFLNSTQWGRIRPKASRPLIVSAVATEIGLFLAFWTLLGVLGLSLI